MNNKRNQQISLHLINKLRGLSRADPKQRLEFPLKINEKKHFQNYHLKGQIQLGSQQFINQFKNLKRNHFDTSDIQGSQPKKLHGIRSEKHLSAMHQYRVEVPETKETKNNQKKKKSESKISYYVQLPKINQQFKYNLRQKMNKKLKTEPVREQSHKDKLAEVYGKDSINYGSKKRSLLYNPTFLSSLFFV